MRNLKKLLAVTVAVIMCFTLMSTGLADSTTAPAITGTNYTAFNDLNDINSKYVDAVALMAALDIIRGIKDGDVLNFNPKGEIKRAEVAKMVYVILNNGYDDGAKLYLNDACSLTDISGHWAEGYIKYCFTRQIIAGMGDGTFKPEANVTGLQLYKMLLVALGYDPIKEGFVGSGWGSMTGIAAQAAQLSDNVEDVDMVVAISREVATQVFKNGLFSTLQEYLNGVRKDRLGDDSFTPLTFAWDKLGLQILEGVLVANDQVSVSSTNAALFNNANLFAGWAQYDVCENGESTIEYKIPDRVVNGVINTGAYSSVTIKTDTPYTMVGKSIYVYVKVKAGARMASFNWVSGIEKVFGSAVEVPGKNIVTFGTSDDYNDDNFKKSGNGMTQFYVNYAEGRPLTNGIAPFEDLNSYANTKANFDSYFNVKNNMQPYERGNGSRLGSGQQIVMISNDGNKSVEYCLAYDKRFGNINIYSNDRLSIAKNDGSNYNTGYYNVKFDDVHDVSNFALNDKVLMWKLPVTGMYMVEKAKELKGTLSGSTGSANSPKAIIGGTQYTIARDHIDFQDVIASDYVGKELTYYMDGSQLCGVDASGVKKTSDKYLVVRGSKAEGFYQDAIEKKRITAAVLTSDGTRATYTVDAIYYNTANGAGKATLVDIHGNGTVGGIELNGEGAFIAYGSNDPTNNVGINDKVFRYSLSSSGLLTLYEPDVYGASGDGNQSKFDYEKGAASVSYNSGGTMHRKALDSDSVAFIRSTVANKDGEFWFLFRGNSNFPNFGIAGGGFSGCYGKISVKDDKFNAIAVYSDNFDKASSTEYFGIVIDSTAERNSNGDWYYKTLTLFDGDTVQKFTCNSNIRVDNSGLTGGYLVNAARGLVVKYELTGSTVSALDSVKLISYNHNNRANVAAHFAADNYGFHAGFVYLVNGSSFTIAEYNDNGRVACMTNYMTDANTNVITLFDDSTYNKAVKDGTIENSYAISKKVNETDYVDYDDWIENNGDATFTHRYSAIVREDDKNDGYAKTIYLFSETQDDLISEADFNKYITLLNLVNEFNDEIGDALTLAANVNYEEVDTVTASGGNTAKDLVNLPHELIVNGDTYPITWEANITNALKAHGVNYTVNATTGAVTATYAIDPAKPAAISKTDTLVELTPYLNAGSSKIAGDPIVFNRIVGTDDNTPTFSVPAGTASYDVSSIQAALLAKFDAVTEQNLTISDVAVATQSAQIIRWPTINELAEIQYAAGDDYDWMNAGATDSYNATSIKAAVDGIVQTLALPGAPFNPNVAIINFDKLAFSVKYQDVTMARDANDHTATFADTTKCQITVDTIPYIVEVPLKIKVTVPKV